MAVIERRVTPRYEVKLAVRFRSGKDVVEAQTYSISRHGIFLLTDQLRQVGELMQLYLELPAGDDEPIQVIRVMAVVAWTLNSAEASQRQRQPGMGMKFYVMASRDKDLWDQLLDRIEREGAIDQNKAGLRVRRAEHEGGPMRYMLRARSMALLLRFATHELAEGETFLRTPLLRRPTEQVDLVLIHPVTEAEFILPGMVQRVHTGSPTERGMALSFLEPKDALLHRFELFVQNGHDSRMEAAV